MEPIAGLLILGMVAWAAVLNDAMSQPKQFTYTNHRAKPRAPEDLEPSKTYKESIK